MFRNFVSSFRFETCLWSHSKYWGHWGLQQINWFSLMTHIEFHLIHHLWESFIQSFSLYYLIICSKVIILILQSLFSAPPPLFRGWSCSGRSHVKHRLLSAHRANEIKVCGQQNKQRQEGESESQRSDAAAEHNTHPVDQSEKKTQNKRFNEWQNTFRTHQH